MATVEQKLTRALQCRRAPLLVPLLHEVAESAQPGATVVRELRRAQQKDINHFQLVLSRAFQALGILVATTTAQQGGLIVEATARETERVAAIVRATPIPQFEQTVLLPLFEEHFKEVLRTTSDALRGVGLPITVRQSLEHTIYEQSGKRMGLLDIRRDVKESLFKVMDAGRELGLNPRTTAGWVQFMVPKGRFIYAGSKYRAELIARTETLNAQRISTINLYKDSPVVKEVMAFDGESDEECAERNGTTMSFDEAEEAAESTHPNCVLAFGPVA